MSHEPDQLEREAVDAERDNSDPHDAMRRMDVAGVLAAIGRAVFSRARPVDPARDPDLSPLAQQVPGGLEPSTAYIRKPWGMCVHTTGRGVVESARRTGRAPEDVAIRIYLKSQRGELHDYRWGGPTYLIDHGGAIYQMAPDRCLTAHAGSTDRPHYLDGSWAHRATPATLRHWRAAWPGHRSPQHLYPAKSANISYVGVEVIPLGAGLGGAPRARGELFALAQYEALARLGRDLAARHGWPDDWARGPRLVGHEDVQPLRRQDSGGGWDPGHLREPGRRYFDLEVLRGMI